MAHVEGGESAREFRKRAELGRILVKEDVQARLKVITRILRKGESARTEDEKQILKQSPDVVEEVIKRQERRTKLTERAQEVEDSPCVIKEKCVKLAEAIGRAKHVVVYTGAGISTAACIPDYRGPNGVWTLLQKGQQICHRDLSEARPTVTHMAVAKLHKKRIIRHVVSQNCDGLHLRSGLRRTALSEVHGNMYIEVCRNCRPPKEYVRLFDVTEKTALYKHKTGRKCHQCSHGLVDTIVHFGEKGTLKSPLNWKGAVAAVKKCDLILCLGTSLKVLRRYSCLWAMDRPAQSRPQLYIVNLQWTPKDDTAILKINGRCDDVMKQVMNHLGICIPTYSKKNDPLFTLATALGSEDEAETTSRKLLEMAEEDEVACDEFQQSPSEFSTSLPDTKESCDNSEMCLTPKSIPCNAEEATCSVTSFEWTKDEEDDVAESSFMQCAAIDVIVSSSFPEDVVKEEECETSDELLEKQKTNTAGWFGKGYRKSRRKKRKVC